MYPTDNYVGSFQFRVSVEGINDPLDGFLKVSTVNSFSEDISWMHGTNLNIRKAPGRNNADDIILTRVYQGQDELAHWRERISLGAVDPRNMTIEILKSNGQNVRTVQLVEAWPIKWQLPEMDASGSNAATEEITLVYTACFMT